MRVLYDRQLGLRFEQLDFKVGLFEPARYRRVRDRRQEAVRSLLHRNLSEVSAIVRRRRFKARMKASSREAIQMIAAGGRIEDLDLVSVASHGRRKSTRTTVSGARRAEPGEKRRNGGERMSKNRWNRG